MAGVAGNAATLAIGKQTAKGTPQTTPAFKLKFTGGDIAPARQIIQLAETDASRQAGASVVVGSSVTGTTNHYVRPTDFGMLAYAVMGANADSGTNPNYTHTATSSAAAPYFTLYKAINSTTLVDQYIDCRATSLNVSGAAGGALTCGVGWMGLSAVLGATDPVLAAVTETPLVYPQITVLKGGSDPGTVDSFSIDVNQGATALAGRLGDVELRHPVRPVRRLRNDVAAVPVGRRLPQLPHRLVGRHHARLDDLRGVADDHRHGEREPQRGVRDDAGGVHRLPGRHRRVGRPDPRRRRLPRQAAGDDREHALDRHDSQPNCDVGFRMQRLRAVGSPRS
jgi:hypothetical protein